MFNQAPTLGNITVSAGSIECNAGLCSAQLWETPENPVMAQNATIRLTGTLDFPEVGMITGEIEIENETGNLACVISSDQGPLLTSCVGQSPQDNTKLLNLMMVSSQ